MRSAGSSVARTLLGAALCLLATGCRHKPPPPPPPPPPIVVTTVPLEKAPEPATPPEVAQVPLPQPPLPAVQPPTAKAHKVRKKPATQTPAPAAPAEVASAGPPPAAGTAIGALTAGGDAAPALKQKVADLLTELDKRLAALPGAAAEAQREGLVRVRYFIREARAALDSGDAEGAEVLVTKAKLLLDDLLK